MSSLRDFSGDNQILQPQTKERTQTIHETGMVTYIGVIFMWFSCIYYVPIHTHGWSGIKNQHTHTNHTLSCRATIKPH